MKKTIVLLLISSTSWMGCLKLGNALSDLNAALLLAMIAGAGYNKFQAYPNAGAFFHESTGDGTWTKITFSGPSKLIDVAQSGNLLFGLDGTTANAVWKSADYGRTWTQISVGSVGAYDRIAACGTNILVARNGTSTYDADTFHSTNSGTTWSSATLQVNPAIGTTAAIRDLNCQGNRFFMSLNRNASGFARVDAPAFSSWTSLTVGLFPYSLTNQMATSDLLIVQYFSSTNPERHISTDNAQSFTGAFQDTGGGGAPTLAFGDNQFYRAYSLAPNCLTDSAANATAVTWTNSKSFNCGAGNSLPTSAAGNSKFIAGGANGSGSTFVIRYDRTAQTLTSETLPNSGPPIARMFYAR